MRQLFRRRNVKREVMRMIREGVGVHEASWDAPGVCPSEVLAEEIVAWIQDAMGEMRRPYGIDHVAVALACKDPGGRVVCSNSFGVLRPGEFYGEHGAARVKAFLDDVETVPAARRREVVAALPEPAVTLRAPGCAS
ncbi:MAG: hypothetical protein WED87_00660, partial [Dehalococcoidia bacterium]